MVFYMRFVAIFLLIHQGYGKHHHQSIFKTEEKPVLRIERPASTTEDPGWLERLRARIGRLVTRYGYDGAKPHIKRAVTAVEKERGVLLDVQGESITSYEYKDTRRAYGRTRPRLRDEPRDDEGEPGASAVEPEEEWVTNLKSYVKKLISQYGKRTLDFHLTPVIQSLEQKHNVVITDIDGDVTVKYKKAKPKMPKVGYRHRRVTKIRKM